VRAVISAPGVPIDERARRFERIEKLFGLPADAAPQPKKGEIQDPHPAGA
jgi:hypothetical protein